MSMNPLLRYPEDIGPMPTVTDGNLPAPIRQPANTPPPAAEKWEKTSTPGYVRNTVTGDVKRLVLCEPQQAEQVADEPPAALQVVVPSRRDVLEAYFRSRGSASDCDAVMKQLGETRLFSVPPENRAACIAALNALQPDPNWSPSTAPGNPHEAL